jgi:hypothetical protein
VEVAAREVLNTAPRTRSINPRTTLLWALAAAQPRAEVTRHSDPSRQQVVELGVHAQRPKEEVAAEQITIPITAPPVKALLLRATREA